MLAWQVRNLNLYELTRAISDWTGRNGRNDHRAQLLKLSSAAALAASELDEVARPTPSSPMTRPDDLVGVRTSRYRYHSSSRASEFEDTHRVEFELVDGN